MEIGINKYVISYFVTSVRKYNGWHIENCIRKISVNRDKDNLLRYNVIINGT